jgi:hypothetical protein
VTNLHALALHNPYAKLTQVTDEEDIAKTPIGSIRMERTKTIE